MKDAYGSKNIYIACGYSDIKLILFDMGMKVMPGYTKHMFQNDLTKYLNSLILLLPYTYDFDVIKTLLEQYYPYECFIINEKYKYYCIKE
ncbi:hypothetical protein KM799_15070 [Clostridium tyrobutyricum]|uniref:hypothetical protein n=1 Tax=Clostridium tyrobutyricum TaxID=1519 RepID=UPI001C38AEE5|nr:hypothetical protein [Clostridium tyrobutyricum]MBV4447914.1 hypothetical protein [Clostridium tyrobutyricum]